MTAELVCAATDPAWLERRREGITATDIVTIAGLVTWDSPWALYHRKLGLLPEVEQSDRMRLGSWLEQSIATEWSKFMGAYGYVKEAGLYRSTARPWQMATPDRFVYLAPARGDRSQDEIAGVLECKSSATRQGWGDDGSDVVPAHVRAQVLWQMDTLGVGTGNVAVVFLPSGEFRSYTIRHVDPAPVVNPDALVPKICDVCADLVDLRAQGLAFYRRMLTNSPPDLDGLEVTTDALRYLHPAPGGTVDLTPKDVLTANLAERYDAAASLAVAAKRSMVELQNEVRAAMGDAHEATVDGRVVFRRTVGKRAGYTVPPGETDTLRRIGKDKHDDV